MNPWTYSDPSLALPRGFCALARPSLRRKPLGEALYAGVEAVAEALAEGEAAEAADAAAQAAADRQAAEDAAQLLRQVSKLQPPSPVPSQPQTKPGSRAQECTSTQHEHITCEQIPIRFTNLPRCGPGAS